MTYGWALIVIAVIVGLIVVVLTSVTQGGVTCATNTTNFNLQEYTVAAAGHAKFVIQNASGKSVSNIVANSTNDFNSLYDMNRLTGPYTKGQNFTIDVNGPTATGNFTNGQVQVLYDWPNLQDINFKILCSGTL